MEKRLFTVATSNELPDGDVRLTLVDAYHNHAVLEFDPQTKDIDTLEPLYILCVALNIVSLSNTEQLHHKPFQLLFQPDGRGRREPENVVSMGVLYKANERLGTLWHAEPVYGNFKEFKV